MLVKILGIIDFIGGLILIFGTKFIPHPALIFLGGILLIKTFIGGIPKDFGSFTDFSAGIIFILLMFFSIPWIICLIVGGLLIQKGIFSFL